MKSSLRRGLSRGYQGIRREVEAMVYCVRKDIRNVLRFVAGR
ncbi:MAG: hypothetical protein ABI791_06470 [Acidobacteriota bacterium]